ncbi:MAG: WxcM-like domain-containing protein [Elusimicrobia bacterium]|nr:WxcM-like domain-containing protein [Elusimicrobiota bacterium]
MKPFVHPLGVCESRKVGEGTRIWAFAHVLPGAVIGRDCNICDHVFIENDVRLGDRVTVKCGVQLWDGLRVEDDVFIGPNATFTNDPFPRSRRRPAKFPVTTLCAGSSIGANATVLPGLSVGAHAMVGAGAVVTRSVPTNAIVMGNPARITGYVDAPASALPDGAAPAARATSAVTRVRGVKLHRFPLIKDLRGNISVGDFEKDIPFRPRRYFTVFEVPDSRVRGEHAHRRCRQFLVCLKGACSIMADDGRAREEFRLDRADIGLYIPPMIWAVQYRYTSDAVLMVFASDPYDAGDYIRDYQQFLSLVRRRRAK